MKDTGPEYVPPFEGEVTFTVANAAGAKKAVKHTSMVSNFDMRCLSKLGLFGLPTAELRALSEQVEGSGEVGQTCGACYKQPVSQSAGGDLRSMKLIR